jgi:chromosome segregation ATPase
MLNPASFKSVSAIVLPLALALTFALPVKAADDKKAGKEQVRQLQQNQRKLEQEKVQLAQEKTQLDGELKDSKLKLAETSGRADAASRQRLTLSKELGAANADKAALIAKVAETEKKLLEAEQKLVTANDAFQRLDGVKTQVEVNLAQRSQVLASCEAMNQAQHQYGMEILEKYQSKGCSSVLLQKEPFTGLKQVQIENMLEAYREKFDRQSLGQTQSSH